MDGVVDVLRWLVQFLFRMSSRCIHRHDDDSLHIDPPDVILVGLIIRDLQLSITV